LKFVEVGPRSYSRDIDSVTGGTVERKNSEQEIAIKSEGVQPCRKRLISCSRMSSDLHCSIIMMCKPGVNHLFEIRWDRADDASLVSGLSDDESVKSSFDELMELESVVPFDLSSLSQLTIVDPTVFDDDEDEAPYRAPAAPLCQLPEHVLSSIGDFLDVRTLCACRQLNRWSRATFSTNQAGWERRCRELWKEKVHVTHRAEELLNSRTSNSAIDAYRRSLLDAQHRCEVSMKELCFDPKSHTGTVWHFRFKESSGPEWTSVDPWYQGRESRRMVFLLDGTVKQLRQDQTLSLPFADSLQGIDIRWRFVRKPIDLPGRGIGAYVRLSVGGRDVPTYVSQRSPNGNWGFLLENCWGVFASFPLPPKTTTAAAAAAAAAAPLLRRRSPRTRRRLEDISEEDRIPKRRRLNDEDVMADHTLKISNECQWREAFLYNLGASRLPDGNDRMHTEP